jgi:16S rRNA (uracil1498-N3)-methyltransferase
VCLPADESHHLLRVMRLARGDEVTVFDGQGREFRARVDAANRGRVTLTLVEAISPSPEPGVSITLVQALLKGEKMDAVVRDATMAGAARIVPVLTERTLIGAAALKRGHAVDRWRRVAVASAKQCRRARLPIIDEPQAFDRWLAGDGTAGAAAPARETRLLLVEPSSGGATVSLRAVRRASPADPVVCLVGPEGGWSTAERDAAVAAGCQAITLGPLTLRADAVPLVAISLVRFAFEGN